MDLYSLLIILIVFILPSLLFLVQTRNKERTGKLPPGPFKFPIIGNMYHLVRDLPHRSLGRLSEIYGPIMFLQLGSKPTLVISSADVAKQIIKTHDVVFSGRPLMYSVKKLSYDYSDMGFAPYGEHWREVRKLTVLELLSAKKVQSFRAVREEELALMINSIGSLEGPVDLTEALLRLANDVMCRVAFGRKFDRTDGFHALLHETKELSGGLSVSDIYPWLRWIHKINGLDANLEKNFRKVDEFYNKVIEEHLDPKRSKAEIEDFVDVLLRVQREHILKIEVTNNHIKGLLMDMFIAGTNTTASAMEWTMTELIKNPRIMKKAQEEIRAVVGEKAMVEESDLPRINYLRIVLKESLRLQPALIARETTEKCINQGYSIPAKTWVFINSNSIMTDESSWEKPEEFLPERFQDKPIDFKGLEYGFIPFGLGRRICPGINFALSINELILANLLYNFDWELPQGMERESLDRMEALGSKKIPLRLVAKRTDHLNMRTVDLPVFECYM